jgi:hypothetical protein
MFSATVIESNKAANWNTYPIRPRSSVSSSRVMSCTTSPSTTTCPASGSRRPTMHLSVTLLPTPE